MVKFHFRLESVLRQRERAEQEAQRKLAAFERERVVLESQLRGFQHMIEQERADLREAIGVGVGNLAAARLQANASLGLARKADAVVLVLAGVCRRRDTAREALADAMRRRKAIEGLRDRQLAAWQSDQRRREEAENDEMVVMRHRSNATLHAEHHT